jgi:hypothetical protein
MPTTDARTRMRTLRGWAISLLEEACAIRGCEEHCWIQDRAFDTARSEPRSGSTATVAVAALKAVLDGIGNTCPECLPKIDPASSGTGWRPRRPCRTDALACRQASTVFTVST